MLRFKLNSTVDAQTRPVPATKKTLTRSKISMEYLKIGCKKSRLITRRHSEIMRSIVLGWIMQLTMLSFLVAKYPTHHINKKRFRMKINPELINGSLHLQ